MSILGASCLSSTLEGEAEESLYNPISIRLNALRFSKWSGQTKSVLLSPSGQLHVKLKQLIAHRGFEYMRKHCKTLIEQELGTCIEIPNWISNPIVRSADIAYAPDLSQSTRKQVGGNWKSRTPSERDIAVYAVELMYTEISIALIRSRKRFNNLFLSEIGYTMVSCEKYPVKKDGNECFINQSSLKFSFQTRESDSPFSLSSIPLTIAIDSEKATNEVDS